MISSDDLDNLQASDSIKEKMLSCLDNLLNSINKNDNPSLFKSIESIIKNLKEKSNISIEEIEPIKSILDNLENSNGLSDIVLKPFLDLYQSLLGDSFKIIEVIDKKSDALAEEIDEIKTGARDRLLNTTPEYLEEDDRIKGMQLSFWNKITNTLKNLGLKTLTLSFFKNTDNESKDVINSDLYNDYAYGHFINSTKNGTKSRLSTALNISAKILGGAGSIAGAGIGGIASALSGSPKDETNEAKIIRESNEKEIRNKQKEYQKELKLNEKEEEQKRKDIEKITENQITFFDNFMISLLEEERDLTLGDIEKEVNNQDFRFKNFLKDNFYDKKEGGSLGGQLFDMYKRIKRKRGERRFENELADVNSEGLKGKKWMEILEIELEEEGFSKKENSFLGKENKNLSIESIKNGEFNIFLLEDEIKELEKSILMLERKKGKKEKNFSDDEQAILDENEKELEKFQKINNLYKTNKRMKFLGDFDNLLKTFDLKAKDDKNYQGITEMDSFDLKHFTHKQFIIISNLRKKSDIQGLRFFLQNIVSDRNRKNENMDENLKLDTQEDKNEQDGDVNENKDAKKLIKDMKWEDFVGLVENMDNMDDKDFTDFKNGLKDFKWENCDLSKIPMYFLKKVFKEAEEKGKTMDFRKITLPKDFKIPKNFKGKLSLYSSKIIGKNEGDIIDIPKGVSVYTDDGFKKNKGEYKYKVYKNNCIKLAKKK